VNGRKVAAVLLFIEHFNLCDKYFYDCIDDETIVGSVCEFTTAPSMGEISAAKLFDSYPEENENIYLPLD
jgi:hypothetical protein